MSPTQPFQVVKFSGDHKIFSFLDEFFALFSFRRPAVERFDTVTFSSAESKPVSVSS